MPVVMITHKYFQDEVFYYFLLQLLASKLCSNTQGKSVSWHLGRVYFRARHCGISAIWKKMPHKIYVVSSNGAQKNRPKDKCYFFGIKYSKTSLTTTLIWRPLNKLTLNFYSLLLSQLPFSSSCRSQALFRQTNIRNPSVTRTQAFSVAQNVPKWRQSVNKSSFSHGKVCTNKFKYLLGDPLSWKMAL